MPPPPPATEQSTAAPPPTVIPFTTPAVSHSVAVFGLPSPTLLGASAPPACLPSTSAEGEGDTEGHPAQGGGGDASSGAAYGYTYYGSLLNIMSTFGCVTSMVLKPSSSSSTSRPSSSSAGGGGGQNHTGSSSSSYAVATYACRGSAEAAVRELHQCSLLGRTVTVQPFKPSASNQQNHGQQQQPPLSCAQCYKLANHFFGYDAWTTTVDDSSATLLTGDPDSGGGGAGGGNNSAFLHSAFGTATVTITLIGAGGVEQSSTGTGQHTASSPEGTVPALVEARRVAHAKAVQAAFSRCAVVCYAHHDPGQLSDPAAPGVKVTPEGRCTGVVWI